MEIPPSSSLQLGNEKVCKL
uniref:Uncharacterized protein n=1 Tax=Rhizophora mucronata TaxID=61149 RepID=A0A2P2IYH0_RHIMU